MNRREVLTGLLVAAVAPALPAAPEQVLPNAIPRARWYLYCDGRSLPIDGWPELFRAIGHTFGPAPEGKFCLPDLRPGAASNIEPCILAQHGDDDDELFPVGTIIDFATDVPHPPSPPLR